MKTDLMILVIGFNEGGTLYNSDSDGWQSNQSF
jgi:hypothetical protein